ncbi:hypothetical protein [Effusibacillus lacus]|uniref:Uncharacterized protein n=1 Tax=Effusibacillus lacus TaxID=1348429 RepID=A0A292YPF7_9BACL|nr:hypothetical protein [Effusibacillus lacus]TCS76280.1 hypothetical protein EDD64_10345 [Effusibacillus lacus]GAX91828.1 hypothetical protein EFBL_3519 [Effusibacillus lacus]
MADKNMNESDIELPSLPKSYGHRASMKWITIESVRVVMERSKTLENKRIVLLTPAGLVEGELTDIAPSYAESFNSELGEELTPNITSMVANVRIDLLRMIEKQEDKLELIDSAPLVGLKNVVVRTTDHTFKLPEITLFADQIAGFTVSRQVLN